MSLAAWVIAAAYVVLELAVSDRYGFQQDELYFLVASHHLAFGYVDQPLAVLLARTTDLFGVLAARLAALSGGGRAAVVIAALVTAIAPVFLGAMHVGNTTPYDLLAWTVVTVCVATALLRDRRFSAVRADPRSACGGAASRSPSSATC